MGRLGGQILRDVQRRGAAYEEAAPPEDPYDVKAQAAGQYNADIDRNRRDYFEAHGSWPHGADKSGPVTQRLMKAGMEAPDMGDSGIAEAVFQEAIRAAAEGATIDDLLEAAPAITDGYAISDEDEARQLLIDAYNQGAKQGQAQRGGAMANDMFKGR